MHVQSVTVDDKCSEKGMTDGEKRKRRMFDDLHPSAMKGKIDCIHLPWQQDFLLKGFPGVFCLPIAAWSLSTPLSILLFSNVLEDNISGLTH